MAKDKQYIELASLLKSWSNTTKLEQENIKISEPLVENNQYRFTETARDPSLSNIIDKIRKDIPTAQIKSEEEIIADLVKPSTKLSSILNIKADQKNKSEQEYLQSRAENIDTKHSKDKVSEALPFSYPMTINSQNNVKVSNDVSEKEKRSAVNVKEMNQLATYKHTFRDHIKDSITFAKLISKDLFALKIDAFQNPLTFIEAGTSDIPIVGTAVGGIRKAVDFAHDKNIHNQHKSLSSVGRNDTQRDQLYTGLYERMESILKCKLSLVEDYIFLTNSQPAGQIYEQRLANYDAEYLIAKIKDGASIELPSTQSGDSLEPENSAYIEAFLKIMCGQTILTKEKHYSTSKEWVGILEKNLYEKLTQYWNTKEQSAANNPYREDYKNREKFIQMVLSAIQRKNLDAFLGHLHNDALIQSFAGRFSQSLTSLIEEYKGQVDFIEKIECIFLGNFPKNDAFLFKKGLCEAITLMKTNDGIFSAEKYKKITYWMNKNAEVKKILQERVNLISHNNLGLEDKAKNFGVWITTFFSKLIKKTIILSKHHYSKQTNSWVGFLEKNLVKDLNSYWSVKKTNNTNPDDLERRKKFIHKINSAIRDSRLDDFLNYINDDVEVQFFSGKITKRLTTIIENYRSNVAHINKLLKYLKLYTQEFNKLLQKDSDIDNIRIILSNELVNPNLQEIANLINQLRVQFAKSSKDGLSIKERSAHHKEIQINIESLGNILIEKFPKLRSYKIILNAHHFKPKNWISEDEYNLIKELQQVINNITNVKDGSSGGRKFDDEHTKLYKNLSNICDHRGFLISLYNIVHSNKLLNQFLKYINNEDLMLLFVKPFTEVIDKYKRKAFYSGHLAFSSQSRPTKPNMAHLTVETKHKKNVRDS